MTPAASASAAAVLAQARGRPKVSGSRSSLLFRAGAATWITVHLRAPVTSHPRPAPAGIPRRRPRGRAMTGPVEMRNRPTVGVRADPPARSLAIEAAYRLQAIEAIPRDSRGPHPHHASPCRAARTASDPHLGPDRPASCPVCPGLAVTFWPYLRARPAQPTAGLPRKSQRSQHWLRQSIGTDRVPAGCAIDRGWRWASRRHRKSSPASSRPPAITARSGEATAGARNTN